MTDAPHPSGPTDPSQRPRPRFRPAEVVTEEFVEQALASGDPDRIHSALVDGSRCLPEPFTYPLALPLIKHEDQRVRWAAVFALDQCVEYIPTQFFTDLEAHHDLAELASADPDEFVRHMAATTLIDLVGVLYNRLYPEGGPEPRFPHG